MKHANNLHKKIELCNKYFGLRKIQIIPQTEINKIRKNLDALARTLLNKNLTQSQIIQVPMGVGKTEAFINALNFTNKDIIFSAPTRELAEDIYNRAKKKNISCFLLFGKQPEECENPEYKNLLHKLINQNINSHYYICKKCNIKCRYKKDLEKAKNYQIIITTHIMALPLAEMRGSNVIVIYDENIDTIRMGKTTWNYVKRKIELLEKALNKQLPLTKLWIKQLQETIINNTFFHDGTLITPIDITDKYIWNNDDFINMAGLKTIKRQARKELKNVNEKKLIKAGIIISKPILELLKGNLENCIFIIGEEKYFYTSSTIPMYHPSITLDATPPVDGIKNGIQIHSFKCKTTYIINGIICKYGKTFAKKISKDNIAQNKFKSTLRLCKQTINPYKQTLVVTKKNIITNKKNIKTLKEILGNNIILRNFGGIRGLDKFKNLDSCLILLNHNLGWQHERILAIEYLKQYGILPILEEYQNPGLLRFYIDKTILILKFSELIQAAGRIRATLGNRTPPVITFATEGQAIAFFCCITRNFPEFNKENIKWFYNFLLMDLVTAILQTRKSIPKLLDNDLTDNHRAIWNLLSPFSKEMIKDEIFNYLFANNYSDNLDKVDMGKRLFFL